MIFSSASGSCCGVVMLWVPLGTSSQALLILDQDLALSQDAGVADGISGGYFMKEDQETCLCCNPASWGHLS